MSQDRENDRNEAAGRHWVGFDLGGTKMLATAYDSQFEQIGRRRKKTAGNQGAEAGLKRMIQTIREALDDAGIQAAQLAGIGIGCPGPLDLDRGIILDTPNLGWKNVPIKKILQAEFDVPVFIANDVDVGVYGEYRFGAGRGARSLLGVFPGTGIGGGAVYQGEIVRGKTGSCMEIGHIPVMIDGPICGCGQQGCLEAVASRLAIAAAAAQAAYRGQAPKLLELAGTDISAIRSGVLAASIAAGDEAVERIVRKAAAQIGMAVASVVNLMAPDTVVLGGGLVEAMPELFIEEVARAAQQRVMAAFCDTFEVVEATLGDDSAVKGAAAWAEACIEAEAK